MNNNKELLNKILFVPDLEPFFESLDDYQRLPHARVQPTPSVSCYDVPINSQVGQVEGADQGARRAPAGCPILDTPTLQVAHFVSSVSSDSTDGNILQRVRAGLSKRNLRLYGRSLAGLQLPGRYYWLTMTSSPQSPTIERSWRALSVWLRRERPGIEWIYCITSEGHGVLHMIFRLPMRSKNIDIKKLRAYWIHAHNARQIKLVRVKNPHDLASYFSDQRRKTKMGREMLHQPGLERWHASQNWLPKGISRHLNRVWYRLRDIPAKVKEITINNWIKRCYQDPAAITDPPFVLTWQGEKTLFNSQADYQAVEDGCET